MRSGKTGKNNLKRSQKYHSQEKKKKQWISSETLIEIEKRRLLKAKASTTQLIRINIEFKLRKFKKR